MAPFNIRATGAKAGIERARAMGGGKADRRVKTGPSAS